MSVSLYVGIDVSKAHLDYAIQPSGEQGQVAYDETGIEQIASRLTALAPSLVVLEATGERSVVWRRPTGSMPSSWLVLPRP